MNKLAAIFMSMEKESLSIWMLCFDSDKWNLLLKQRGDFCFIKKLCFLIEQKTLRVDRTAAEQKHVLKRPAAGGVSLKRDTFFYKRIPFKFYHKRN